MKNSVFVSFILLAVHCGCASRSALPDDEQVFGKIKVGMSREQVEEIAGRPVTDDQITVHYGDPPKIEPWQSPVSVSSIAVTYSNGVVQSKKYYGGMR